MAIKSGSACGASHARGLSRGGASHGQGTGPCGNKTAQAFSHQAGRPHAAAAAAKLATYLPSIRSASAAQRHTRHLHSTTSQSNKRNPTCAALRFAPFSTASKENNGRVYLFIRNDHESIDVCL